ncbi:MAG: altronate hydrolase [Betaproteobacteria bacterium]|nr:MAG: altronate hydrolase [Betaproteobacteria bacterium]
MAKTFLGYPRENGTVGVRNWVAVVSVMDNCNPVTRAICAQVDGTIAVTTLFVRGQYGRDLEIAYNTLAGMGRNPNIAAVLLVGLEEQTTEEVARRIRPAGKPVEAVHLQPNGTINCVAEGTRRALRLVVRASNARRRSCATSELMLGVQCGGSDTTSGLTCNPVIGRLSDRVVEEGGTVIISETSEFFGAEHLFAARAASPAIAKAFTDMVVRLEREAMSQGMDIRGTNPTPDNMRGGLTTIEEKALGAMAKSGTSRLRGVLSYGEAPSSKGLHFLDAPAPAVENLTALAAAGCQLVFFGTGVGNPIGNMVSPTAKVSGNVNTLRTMADNIDFDASDILEKKASVGAVGDRLYDYAIEVASGTRTSSEILDVRETAISRFAPTI